MSVFRKYVSHDGGSAHCPECRETISRQANICPHCRSDLKENETWQKAKNEPASAGCITVIAISFIGLSALVYATNWVLS